MSTEEFNPFASPAADISETKAPEADDVYPLIPTTKADVTNVPAPFAGAARSMWQRFLRAASESIVKVAFASPFILIIAFVPEFYSVRMLLAVTVGLPFLWLITRLENLTAHKAWWKPRMVDQLKVRPDALFSAEETPYQLVFLTTGAPKKVRSFRLTSGTSKIVDIGLIRFDEAQGEILLEADKKRYRIPRGSLWTFDVRELRLDNGKRAAVRVVLDTNVGPQELHLLPPETHTWRDLIRLDWTLVRRAEELTEQIYHVNHGNDLTD